MDVGGWLRGLGLSQYETLFRQNDIDAEVLSELTDGDLEKFGVSFGHRKRLLKAIASLGSSSPVPCNRSSANAGALDEARSIPGAVRGSKGCGGGR